MSNESFNIINYLAGLTGYVFDIDVLNRVALECGVIDIVDFSEMTNEKRDRCKMALLETLLITPYSSASQTDKHGDWQTQTGSQSLTSAVIENVKNELVRLYKVYNENDKLKDLEQSRANLQWIDFE